MQPVQATRLGSQKEVLHGPVGGYFIDREHGRIYMKHPVSNRREGDPFQGYCDLAFSDTGENSPNGPVWKISGTDDCPSLQPSIHSMGEWHGYLTNGQFTTC